jgi:putative DNA primase/helicase
LDELFGSPKIVLAAGEVYGVGLYPGPANRVVLDVDVKGGKQGDVQLATLEAEYGALPPHPIVDTASGGVHRWLAKPQGVHVGNPDLADGIEVRADAGWVVAPGTFTPWGSWTVRDGTDIPAPMWPDWVAAKLNGHRGSGAGRTTGRWQQLDRAALDLRDLAALEALERLGGHGAVLGPGGEVRITRPGKTAGTSASVGYVDPGVVKVFTDEWPPLRKDSVYAVDALEALERGEGNPAEERRPSGTTDTGLELPDGHRATDVCNAARLLEQAGGRLHYVHAWGKWVVYQRGRWTLDENDALVTEQGKCVARALFALAAKATDKEERKTIWSWALRSEASGSIAAMVRLARGIPGVLVEHEELDADPYLLNVRNGTIDLRTGQLRLHDPADLITVQCPVSYDLNAKAPLWEACLQRWQPDPEVRDYIQLRAGAGTTGKPTETVDVDYGSGSNGKSKFWGAIQHVLGDYAVVPHKSLLVAQRHEQHDTVKARLFRKRLAVASETKAADTLDDEQVKNLTGGDRLQGRRMREDPWEFNPTHTLVMFSNHKPAVQGRDEGIWRRLRLVPWAVTIPENERDDDLAAKLRAEAPGILSWLVDGARRFIAEGLTPPDVVRAATDAYRADEDAIGRFVARSSTSPRRRVGRGRPTSGPNSKRGALTRESTRNRA